MKPRGVGIIPSTFIVLALSRIYISPILNTVYKIIIISIIISSIRFPLLARPLVMVIFALDSLSTSTNASMGGFTCLLWSIDLLLMSRDGEVWSNVIFCIRILSGSLYLLMSYRNVPSIGHIKRAEWIVFHESDIFTLTRVLLLLTVAT